MRHDIAIAAEFADVVYTDDQFVRDEFDALVAANWGPPRDRSPHRRGPSPPPAAAGRRHVSWTPPTHPDRTRDIRWRRERSPPAIRWPDQRAVLIVRQVMSIDISHPRGVI
jgi:hypothetical protein